MDQRRSSQQLKYFSAFFFAGALLLAACKHDPPVSLTPIEVSTGEISFRDQVQPILNSNCNMSGCHNSSSAAEGIDLSSYASIMSEDELVVRFKPDESELMEELRGYGRKGSMPPSGQQLSADQISILKQWIVEGARNSFWAQGPCDTLQSSYAAQIAPIMDNYCNGCHSQAATGGGILLNSYELTKASAQSGKLLASVKHTGAASPMPKGGNKLNDCQIIQIERWISNNYPN